MAKILNDQELKKALDKIIIDGDVECIRPNSYVLRLGKYGEFLIAQKEFEMTKKQGIILASGHSVAVTALETIDFRRDAVNELFPECDLHGILSPTTDLSREGLTVSSTQIDAGYHGTLNWTITNHSSREAKFIFGEKIFRLTIFKLEKGEKPEFPYAGDYQGKEGYVGSARKGAPAGMKESDWITSHQEGGPENQIEELIKSGYPWNILGTRFKEIDEQFKTITDEYNDIYNEIKKLNKQVEKIDVQQQAAKEDTRQMIREEMTSKEDIRKLIHTESDSIINKVIIKVGAYIVGGIGILSGLIIAIFSDEIARGFIINNSSIIGLVIIIVAAIILGYIFFKK